MPRDLPRFAFCSGPGVAKSHKTLDGLLGVVVSAWFAAPIGTAIGAIILGIVLPMILLGPCLGVIPAVIAITAMLQDFKDWYYNERLLCVADRNNCVVGAVLHEPSPSQDGDRKLDLLLAPFTEPECLELICRHLNANQGLLGTSAVFNDPPFFDGTVPKAYEGCDPDILTNPNADASVRLAERAKLAEYLEAIKGEDPQDGDATSNVYNNMLVGWMDRLLDPGNTNAAGEAKNFQGRFYRKDATIIAPGTALSDAIPPDFDPATNWQDIDGSMSPLTSNNPYEVQHQPRGVNPMFRFDKTRLLPFLHCEIDGNYIQLLMDELSLAVVTFGTTYFFACIALPGWFKLLAPVIAAILAFLVWLLQRELNGGENRGQADPVDVEFDDPGNFGEDGQQLDGDLAALYGPWIMDTEHAQYFEIHPVKAYFVLGRNARSGEIDPFDSNAEVVKSGAGRLHNGSVTADMVKEICEHISKAEEEDPGPVIERTGPTVLSYGLNTYYAGGGFRAID
ncbi:MAG: hypothetical protein P8Y01_00630 [Woeseiaceae bacterium]|jgi:hypothetical protein